MSKVVKVEWVDATLRSGWVGRDETIENCKPMAITSYGVIISRTKDHLILAASFGKDGDVGNVSCIPKPWMVKVTELKEK